ncbi:hypothetical protein TNCV_2408251 [Trichonephila clavipes]|nr:hypothetical protein TNCV_2408251 [Trichonephila clavipes]
MVIQWELGEILTSFFVTKLAANLATLATGKIRGYFGEFGTFWILLEICGEIREFHALRCMWNFLEVSTRSINRAMRAETSLSGFNQ